MSNKPRYKIGEEVFHLKHSITGVIKEIDLDRDPSFEKEPNYFVDFGSFRMWVFESEIRYVSSQTEGL